MDSPDEETAARARQEPSALEAKAGEERRVRRLLLVHGHGHKPPAGELENLWRMALGHGLERDHGRKLGKLADIRVSLAYYGDLTRGLRRHARAGLDEELDIADRYLAFRELAGRASSKEFRSHHYHRMRGRSSRGKLAMHLAAPIARGLGLDDALLARVSPELARYRSDAAFADAVRARVLEVLEPALADGEDVFLLTHCMGSVVAYDCLWLLSRGERALRNKVGVLVTLGSPLASDAVRTGLLGAERDLDERYPTNIESWFNIAAEDDYVCHDATVANDFAPMIGRRGISRLEDIGIFNFARRYGRSNPHNSLGYLVHPHTVRLLAEWLQRR
ncbi:MAG: hypothetical protein V2J24_05435 [Pseudomonadales bacterium]|jgi:hypothetical protein|nr:hypothetical protein [Pseudomonadales bacterium]